MVNFTYTSENLAHRGHSSLLLSAICLRCYSQARGPEKHIPVIRTLWFDLNPLILPQPISRLGNNFFFKLLIKWHSHSKCSKTSILLNKMFLMSDVTECVCVFNINGSWCMCLLTRCCLLGLTLFSVYTLPSVHYRGPHVTFLLKDEYGRSLLFKQVTSCSSVGMTYAQLEQHWNKKRGKIFSTLFMYS